MKRWKCCSKKPIADPDTPHQSAIAALTRKKTTTGGVWRVVQAAEALGHETAIYAGHGLTGRLA